MNIIKPKYYIDRKAAPLPSSSFRQVSKDEYGRLIELILDNYKIAHKRVPEVQEIIKEFDGRPAKAKFEAALNEHGFTLDRNSIYMPLTSNCILSEAGDEIVGAYCFKTSGHDLRKGIEVCGFLKFDEEGLLDAERTIRGSDKEDTMQTNIRWIEKAIKELSDASCNEWIDKAFEARCLINEIYKNAPEELKYRLFEDVLQDATEYC